MLVINKEFFDQDILSTTRNDDSRYPIKEYSYLHISTYFYLNFILNIIIDIFISIPIILIIVIYYILLVI